MFLFSSCTISWTKYADMNSDLMPGTLLEAANNVSASSTKNRDFWYEVTLLQRGLCDRLQPCNPFTWNHSPASRLCSDLSERCDDCWLFYRGRLSRETSAPVLSSPFPREVCRHSSHRAALKNLALNSGNSLKIKWCYCWCFQLSADAKFAILFWLVGDRTIRQYTATL